MKIIVRWLLLAAALLLVAYLYPGVTVKSFGSAMIAAFVLGLFNTLLRPILVLLTLPVTVLTLGLFLFVINALMFYFAASMLDGFHDNSPLLASKLLAEPQLARRNDVRAITALLVRNRHRADGAAKPCRRLDGRVDLGDAPIEVGHRLPLDREARIGVGGSIRERQIDRRNMIKVGARQESEHTDRVQAHQHADHRDEDQAQEGRRRVPILGQPGRCDELPGFERSAHGDHGPERAGKDRGEAIYREGGRHASERQRHDECGELDR